MSWQQQFVDALLRDSDAASLPCPVGLVSWNGSDPARRFAVYRNNVVVSLIDALANSFAVAQELVGEDFFRAMARRFVREAPPRSRMLAFYGQDFPAFIDSFAPAADVPYLGDVARLEMLRILAYHAADRAVLTPAQVAAVLGGELGLEELRFALHPSVAVLRSRHAVVSLWGAHQGLLDIGSVQTDRPETALVVRIGLEVSVVGVDAASGCFIEQLLQGVTVVQAAAACECEGLDFDLAASLAALLRWHCIASISPVPRG
ncbi:MAG: DNA-binding domain-containing protein [Betaproteobacteria bacterium]